MIPQHSFHAAKNRSAQLLVSRGYEPVQPVTCSELAHAIPLHVIGLKGNYEALCVKLRIARQLSKRNICRILLPVRHLPVPLTASAITGECVPALRSPGRVAGQCDPLLRSPENRHP